MLDVVLISASFVMGSALPADYTCTGRNVSPPLAWSGAPQGVASYAVICDDPDSRGAPWAHWVLFNLLPGTAALPEGVPARPRLPDGGVQGINSFGTVGYDGPCPPPGKPHRYVFKVYALDRLLPLGEQARKEQVEAAMQGHILAEGQAMGTFQR